MSENNENIVAPEEDAFEVKKIRIEKLKSLQKASLSFLSSHRCVRMTMIALCVLSSVVVIYMIGCNGNERVFIRRSIANVLGNGQK